MQYYLNGSMIVAEVTGDVQTDYYYDESGNVFGFKRGNSEYYYIRNGQGDIIGILDSSGTQVVSYVYDSWGKLVSISGSQADTIGEMNPFRCRGYYYDTESGLYYLQSRYYDPEIGRFINADGWLGANGDILAYNLLAYCGNNPVNLSDPTGEVAASTIVLCASILIAATAETFSPAGQERVQKAINEPSFYNITNQLTLGALDTFKGTFAPEEPLSLQHWVDSANTAFMLLPISYKFAGTMYSAPSPLVKSAIGNPYYMGVFDHNGGYGFTLTDRLNLLYQNPRAAGGPGGTFFAYNNPLNKKFRLDWDPAHGFHAHIGRGKFGQVHRSPKEIIDYLLMG